MHFVGPDQLHGFEERLTTDVYPADLDWTPDWRVPLTERLPWYHTMESVLRAGRVRRLDADGLRRRGRDARGRMLRDLARSARRPFFLAVSFTHPHDPWELRPRYWDRYDPAAIDAAAVPPIPREAADPHSLRLRDMCRRRRGGARRRADPPRAPRLLRGDLATPTSASARCSGRCRVRPRRTTRSCSSPPTTARCSASGGSGTRWPSSSPSARVPLLVWAPGRLAPGARRRAGLAARPRADAARAVRVAPEDGARRPRRHEPARRAARRDGRRRAACSPSTSPRE